MYVLTNIQFLKHQQYLVHYSFSDILNILKYHLLLLPIHFQQIHSTFYENVVHSTKKSKQQNTKTPKHQNNIIIQNFINILAQTKLKKKNNNNEKQKSLRKDGIPVSDILELMMIQHIHDDILTIVLNHLD